MKKIKWSIFGLFLVFYFTNVNALEIVARNEMTNMPYTDIDKAIEEAHEKDIILLYKDVTPIKTFYKSLTFKGNHKITYNVYGWRYEGELVLDNASLFVNSLKDSKKANNGEAAQWVSMVLSGKIRAINNANVTFTFDSNYGVTNAIYAGAKGVKIEVDNNSKFNIYGKNTRGKSGQGIQLDSTANTGIFVTNNSSFLIDGTNRGYVNSPIIYVKDSWFTVQNTTANASNGGEFQAINSKIFFLNNGGHGLSATTLKLSNKSFLQADNNLYYGVTITNSLNVDSASSLQSTKNGSGYIGGGVRLGLSNKILQSSGNVLNGSKIIITNNYRHGIENYGNLLLDNTSITEIKENKENGYGAGVYNAGAMKIMGEVSIYNNHALLAADDIYNKENSHLIFNKVHSNLYLSDCNDLIDDWYIDSKESRWNAHNLDNMFIENYKGVYDTTNNLLLKAAHKQKGRVLVRFVDESGNVLANEEEIEGYIDTEYKTNSKKILKYYLLKVDGEEKGKFSINDTVVTYIYKKQKGELVVKHMDEEGNILKEDNYTDYVDNPYETKSEEFNGYIIKSEPDNSRGVYKEEQTTVVYVYTRLKGVLEVNYVDNNGNKLHDTIIKTGYLNISYETTKLDISKYNLLKIDGDVTGIYKKDKTVVTYIYEKQKGKLTVKYMDEEGNILKEDNYTDYIDNPYETESEEFKGYVLMQEPDNKTGIYKEEQTVVTYIYSKITSTIQNADIPKTGNNNSNYLISIIITILSFSIFILTKRI